VVNLVQAPLYGVNPKLLEMGVAGITKLIFNVNLQTFTISRYKKSTFF
jgi:hypothetical protein